MRFAFAILVLLSLSQPAVADRSVRDFSSWSVSCEVDEQTQKQHTCRLYQRLIDTDSGNVVMVLSIERQESSVDPSAILRVPLGIRLDQDVQLSVDGGEPTTIQVEVCTTDGCFSSFPVDATLLRVLKQGQALGVTVIRSNAERTPVTISFPLKGFTRAYDYFVSVGP